MPLTVFRQLLLADLALEQEQAKAPQIAAALEEMLSTSGGDGPPDLADALVAAGRCGPAEAAALRADAALYEDAEHALEARRRQGRLADLLAHAGPRLRQALRELGVGKPSRLRTMPAGRYEDYLPVGKGGMGVVYGVRDVDLNREVAMKIIHLSKGGALGDVTPIDPIGLKWPPETAAESEVAAQIEARFLQEAWITGSMTHPGIVPVYELGQTATGVPYYTMRYIEGRRTLADAIAELRGKPLERRLPLLDAFLDVCDTIRYAHSRGVLHRDLKPSNVILGEYGEVVVVDWGLARVQRGPDQTIDQFDERIEFFQRSTDLKTRPSALGTPGYMAPEAAAGDVERVTEQSDVYSLSAVLFEILTGELPIPVTNLDDYLSAVQAGQVARARQVNPDVPGPLATLCAQGLQLEQRDRLGSVAELAGEVRRWRAEAAVEREVDALTREAETTLTAAGKATGAAVLPHLELASHASRRIQALKPENPEAARLLEAIHALRSEQVRVLERAARKTLLSRISVAAVVLAAVFAVAVSLVLEQRRQEAADARAAATASRDRAERVMTFMVEDLQDDLEPIGRLDLLTKIGARARAYYDDQPLEAASDAGLHNRATALRRLGDAYRLRGDLVSALSAYEASGATGSFMGRSANSELDGLFETSLAEIRISEVLFQQGYPTRAEALLQKVERELARLSKVRTNDSELLLARSDAAARLVSVLLSAGKPEDALRLAERSLSLAEQAAALAGRGNLAVTRSVLQRRLVLADARYGPKLTVRVRELRRTLADIQGLAKQAPDDVRWQALEASARLRLAVVLRRQVLNEEAEEELLKANTLLERLVRRDPSNLAWASQLARAQRQHGDTLLSLKRYAKALALYHEAYERMRSLFASDPTNGSWLTKLITLCDRLVIAGTRLGTSPIELDRWREEAVSYARRLLERDPENARHRHILAYTMQAYSDRLLQRRDFVQAVRLTTEAEQIIVDLLRANPDNREAAVLLAWNTRLRVGLSIKQGNRTGAVVIGLHAESVLAGILRHRPDFWMVREELLRLQLERAGYLAGGTPKQMAEATGVRRGVEAAISARRQREELSEGERASFSRLETRADELLKPAAESK